FCAGSRCRGPGAGRDRPQRARGARGPGGRGSRPRAASRPQVTHHSFVAVSLRCPAGTLVHGRRRHVPGDPRGVAAGRVGHTLDPMKLNDDLEAKFNAQITLELDRKSTRLNSSHVSISYAVFCLKNKTKKKLAAAADDAT